MFINIACIIGHWFHATKTNENKNRWFKVHCEPLTSKHLKQMQMFCFDLKEFETNSTVMFWFQSIWNRFNRNVLISKHLKQIQILCFDVKAFETNSTVMFGFQSIWNQFKWNVCDTVSLRGTATALIRFPWDSSDSHGTKCEEILKVQILVDLKEPRFRCHTIFIFLKCSYFWKLLSNVPALHGFPHKNTAI